MTDLVTRVELSIEPASQLELTTKVKARISTAASAFCDVNTTGFWFPVAPGTTTLPEAPAVTVNATPIPANAVPVPEDFDETDLCYLFQDLLPIAQPPVYPVELDPAVNLQPYTEVVPLLGITVAGLSIREYPYELVLPTETIAAVVRTVINIPTYLISAGAGSLTMTGQVAGLLRNRKLTANAGAFALTGLGSGFVREYLIGTNAGTFATTGQDAGLRYDRLPLAAEAGAFTLSGQDAGSFLGKTLSAEAGSFTVSGQAAGLTRPERLLAAEAESFVLSGQAATLTSTPAPQAALLFYTGNASSTSLTGVGFKPGFLHLTRSDVAASNYIHDYLRGSTVSWIWSTTGTQSTDANGVTSFDSDGITVGTSATFNGNGNGYVGFLLKEGGASSTDTSGSIQTTTVTNSVAKYSIFSYTGNGTTNQTVGHGLGETPDLVILKNRTTTGAAGVVGAPAIGTGKYIATNSGSESTGAETFIAFNTNTIEIGNSSFVNGSSRGYVGYAFKSSDSVKVGTFSGENTATVTVTLGFRPTWVYIKSYGLRTSNHLWFYRTASGDGFAEAIVANTNTTAPVTSTTVSITSTGFTVAAGGVGNSASGAQAIYIAAI